MTIFSVPNFFGNSTLRKWRMKHFKTGGGGGEVKIWGFGRTNLIMLKADL